MHTRALPLTSKITLYAPKEKGRDKLKPVICLLLARHCGRYFYPKD